MSIQGNKLVAPIGLAEVYSLLGVSPVNGIYDVVYICGNAHGKTNPYAKYKPIRVNQPGDITDAQRTAANHGLSAVEVPGIVAADGVYKPGIPGTAEWTYLPPRPGTDWCRLTDFLSPAGDSGYYHAAKPPANGFQSVTIYSDQFYNSTLTYRFNAKFGSASYEGIGDTSGMEISLNDLTLISGQPITNGKWRFGLAVFFPDGEGNYIMRMASHEQAIVSGGSTADIAKMIIDFGASRQLAEQFDDAFNNNHRTLTAIPCICYNLSHVTAYPSRFDFMGDGRAFCMPGGETVKIYLRDIWDSFGFSITNYKITYQNVSAGTHTLLPNSGYVEIPKPSGSSSVSVEVIFIVNGDTGHAPKFQHIIPGLGGSFINTTSMAQYYKNVNGNWQSCQPSDIVIGGTYKVVAMDSYSGGGRTPISALLNGMSSWTGESWTQHAVGLSLRTYLDGMSGHGDKTAGSVLLRLT